MIYIQFLINSKLSSFKYDIDEMNILDFRLYGVKIAL